MGSSALNSDSQIFDTHQLKIGDVYDIENPGGGHCLFYTVIVYLRIELLVHNARMRREQLIEIRHMMNNSDKFNIGFIGVGCDEWGDCSPESGLGDPVLGPNSSVCQPTNTSLYEDSMKLRECVCNWLDANLLVPMSESGETFFDAILYDQLPNIREKPPINQEEIKKWETNIVDKYIQNMRKYSEWGGQIEILAISRVLKRDIRAFVIKHDDKNLYEAVMAADYPGQNLPTIGIKQHIVMGKRGKLIGAHYSTLFNKQYLELKIKCTKCPEHNDEDDEIPTWQCHRCTFDNDEDNTNCDMCKASKKGVPKSTPNKDTSEIYNNNKLVVKKVFPKPVPKKEAPKPVPKKEAPKPVPKKEAPKPVPKKEAPKPVPKKEAPKPVPKKEAPKPVPKKEAPKPASKVVSKKKVAKMVTKNIIDGFNKYSKAKK